MNPQHALPRCLLDPPMRHSACSLLVGSEIDHQALEVGMLPKPDVRNTPDSGDFFPTCQRWRCRRRGKFSFIRRGLGRRCRSCRRGCAHFVGLQRLASLPNNARTQQKSKRKCHKSGDPTMTGDSPRRRVISDDLGKLGIVIPVQSLPRNRNGVGIELFDPIWIPASAGVTKQCK